MGGVSHFPGAFPDMGDDDALAAIEAARLADALAALDRGLAPDLDPREDPELHALVGIATTLRNGTAAATTTPEFEAYRTRSRAFVLHTLEQEHRTRVIPLARRRWFALPVAAAAAAAAALALAVLSLPAGGRVTAPQQASQAASAPTANLTARATDADLDHLHSALNVITEQSSRGTPISADALRRVREGSATFAQRIATQPESVDKDAVVSYLQAAHAARGVLQSASVADGNTQALEAARAAVDDGVIAAARYLQQTQKQNTPAGTPTPTGTAVAGNGATPTDGVTGTR